MEVYTEQRKTGAHTPAATLPIEVVLNPSPRFPASPLPHFTDVWGAGC